MLVQFPSLYGGETPSPLAQCFIVSLRTACGHISAFRIALRLTYIWRFHLHKEGKVVCHKHNYYCKAKFCLCLLKSFLFFFDPNNPKNRNA